MHKIIYLTDYDMVKFSTITKKTLSTCSKRDVEEIISKIITFPIVSTK